MSFFRKKKQTNKTLIWGAISTGVVGLCALGAYLKKYKKSAEDTAKHHKFHGFRLRKVRTQAYSWKRFFKDHKRLHGLFAGFLIFSLWSAPFLEDYGYLFRSSLIGMEPTPFTGTVSPVKKVPNWVELSQSERKMHYDDLPEYKLINLPKYDLRAMVVGKEWTAHNEDERNTYISYPVPNLGNYKLDATENSGSHTGVDIKLPIGTPIHAIANGRVYKVANTPTGFGKHIVLAHVSIPDPENTNQKTTIYSSYSHLSEILIEEGDFIRKDDLIAKSGNTGMATAPHLHFQIDRASAAFHPYWPFDWDDVKAAGVGSYFEAVKKGVGKVRGIQHTVHPMNYVAQFENFIEPRQLIASTVIPDEIIKDIPEPEVAKETEKEETTEVEFERAVVAKEVVSTNVETKTGDLDIIFQTDRKFVPGQEAIIKVRVSDSRLIATAGIAIDSTLGRLANITPKQLTQDYFENNVAEVKIKTDSDNTFKIIAKGNFGEKKSPSLRAQVFKDVATSHKYAPAIAYLRRNEIVKGYDNGTFKPDGILNRAEAVKILLTANDIAAQDFDVEFTDVPDSAWFAPYVATAFKKEIVKGYSDGSFKPSNTITRAEFLKVAIATGGFPVLTITENPYRDIDKDAWFAPYFEFAKTHRLIEAKRGGAMTPHQPITRAEAAQVMYQLADVRLLAKGE